MSDAPHPAALPLEQLRHQCAVERVRRSGPGGQHRNKVETGIVIVHKPTGVRAEANERRSQAENLAMAWQRLRVRLALTIRTVPPPDKPSSLWQARVPNGEIKVGREHEDYPTLLAEALDCLATLEWDISRASEQLGVSRSQLTKFLRREPEALAQLNSERAKLDLRPLV